MLLGEIIEAVSGLTYERFITERILKPLQMNSTGVAQDIKDQALLASGYSRKLPDGSRKKHDFMDAKAGAAMGGMASDVIDLSKFLCWQMRLLATG